VVATSVDVVSKATIHRLGTTNPLTHFFRQSNGDVGTTRLYTASGSAAGIGDVVVRLKGTVLRRASGGLALGLDLRLPTGDEMNLLGAGTAGVQPFAVWSATYGRFAPHLNAGYRWNGDSVLAGTPARGESGPFPDQFTYAAGADLSVNPRLTLAFDLLGTYMIDAQRLRREDFHALDGESTFHTIAFGQSSFNALSGSVGFKANLVERLLLDVNLLFKLDEHGLRDKVTPLVGIEYSF